MNNVMIVPGITAKRPLPAQQVYLVAVFVALFLVAMVLPLANIHIPHEY